LKKADIIDDIVDDFEPKCFVAPIYDKKEKEYPVALGNTLKPSKARDSPSLKIYCPELQATSGLTIILTDPDAPSRSNPKWSEMCHWIEIIPTERQHPFEFALPTMKDEVVECGDLRSAWFKNLLTMIRQTSWTSTQDRLPSICLSSSGRRQHEFNCSRR
jgi:hypothetical protein